MNRFETFTALVNRISKNIRKIKNEEMSQYGLKNIHVSILYFIYLSSSLTASDLCERCEEDKATISRSLSYLENNDYLRCDTQGMKRYNSPFYLTDKGLTVGKEIAYRIDTILETLSQDISEEERIILYKCLRSISNQTDQYIEKYNE